MRRQLAPLVLPMVETSDPPSRRGDPPAFQITREGGVHDAEVAGVAPMRVGDLDELVALQVVADRRHPRTGTAGVGGLLEPVRSGRLPTNDCAAPPVTVTCGAAVSRAERGVPHRERADLAVDGAPAPTVPWLARRSGGGVEPTLVGFRRTCRQAGMAVAQLGDREGLAADELVEASITENSGHVVGVLDPMWHQS